MTDASSNNPAHKGYPRSAATVKREFQRILEQLAGHKRPYEIFRDWAEMAAISVHQLPYHAGERPVDAVFEGLEQQFSEREQRYTPEERKTLSHLFALTMEGLATPNDFLGELYCELGFTNTNSGQFFTPYTVSRMIAHMQMGNMEAIVREKGVITVEDPACGAGGMLVAATEEALSQGLDPRQILQFYATDIDRDCFNMTYLQLSLLEVQGTVRHGNTLSQEIWETRDTPQMQFFKDWLKGRQAEERIRRMLDIMKGMDRPSDSTAATPEPEIPEQQPTPDIVFNPQQLSLFDWNELSQGL
ncbi:MAG: SAM-dependent methyltransferase [Stenomitos rutilans HA7619-LM2]|nr:SAM-dependent methyltransferase [Stenomitos rutilans HA7619-LM2]